MRLSLMAGLTPLLSPLLPPSSVLSFEYLMKVLATVQISNLLVIINPLSLHTL